jgi:ribosome-binding factor A
MEVWTVADPARARRLAVRVREVVAKTLERGVKDPRLGMVTITDARVTPDLMEATVFYTVYGDDEARTASAKALESAKGMLRAQVGRATGVKSTPSLTFVHDRLPDDARHLDDLLAVAKARDEQLATSREGASHAGEADPYRRPRDLADGEDLDDLDDLAGNDDEYADLDDEGSTGVGSAFEGASLRPSALGHGHGGVATGRESGI